MDGFGQALAALADNKQVEVWPENWPAWSVFCTVNTQWRTGFNGPTGLDYTVLFRVLDESELSKPEWRQIFSDVRQLEAYALTEMRGATEPDQAEATE